MDRLVGGERPLDMGLTDLVKRYTELARSNGDEISKIIDPFSTIDVAFVPEGLIGSESPELVDHPDNLFDRLCVSIKSYTNNDTTVNLNFNVPLFSEEILPEMVEKTVFFHCPPLNKFYLSVLRSHAPEKFVEDLQSGGLYLPYRYSLLVFNPEFLMRHGAPDHLVEKAEKTVDIATRIEQQQGFCAEDQQMLNHYLETLNG
jgi:hypothetical protein